MKVSKLTVVVGGLLLAGVAFAEEMVVPEATPEVIVEGEIEAGGSTAQEEVVTEEVVVEEESDAPVENGADQAAEQPAEEQEPKTWAVLVGFLQGGGSLLGADLEALVFNRFALQAGAGYAGFGAAVNFHFQPTLRSDYLSLVYWHQGFSADLSQQAVGLTYGFRSFDWLTAQIGVGYVTSRGETATNNLKSAYDTETLSRFMVLYSLGVCF